MIVIKQLYRHINVAYRLLVEYWSSELMVCSVRRKYEQATVLLSIARIITTPSGCRFPVGVRFCYANADSLAIRMPNFRNWQYKNNLHRASATPLSTRTPTPPPPLSTPSPTPPHTLRWWTKYATNAHTADRIAPGARCFQHPAITCS